jgi:hypothetical protein
MKRYFASGLTSTLGLRIYSKRQEEFPSNVYFSGLCASEVVGDQRARRSNACSQTGLVFKTNSATNHVMISIMIDAVQHAAETEVYKTQGN